MKLMKYTECMISPPINVYYHKDSEFLSKMVNWFLVAVSVALYSLGVFAQVEALASGNNPFSIDYLDMRWGYGAIFMMACITPVAQLFLFVFLCEILIKRYLQWRHK